MANNVLLQFLGAAGTVTGSKHLLKTPGMTILVDCGLFQGIKPLRELNWKELPIESGKIDIVLLTHAHLDHCGYLPLLVRNGFNGKVLMTAPTKELAELILRDSARIQEEDAERANKAGYSKHAPALPLYDRQDAETAISQFKVCQENEWTEISEQVKFRFRRNGHILGSCFIEMDCYGKRIVFSGDIGRKNATLLHDPERPEQADFLIIESTYGDRLHKDESPLVQLAAVINDTIARRGNLLVSSFAVGRAQELIILINTLKQQLRIPNIPVYFDSPMGSEASNALFHHRDWHKLNDMQLSAAKEDVKEVRRLQESLKIMKRKESKIVIAASGMLSGGRVLYYLKEYLRNPKNTILLTGFQAEGTRGRALQNGQHEIKIHGQYYGVRAEVAEIRSLSAHADQKELIQWVDKIQSPQGVYIVHGEPGAAHTFRVKLQDTYGWQAKVPSLNEEVLLFETGNA